MAREYPPPPRAFTEADQTRFARLSGDWNPMHMDPIAARRTLAGAPVVHDIHAALWALDSLIGTGTLRGPIAAIAVACNKFVYLTNPAQVTVERLESDIVELAVIAGGVVTTTVTVTMGVATAMAPEDESAESATLPDQLPNAPAFAAMAGQTGWIEPQADMIAVAAMFPAVSAAIGAGRVAAIALTSRLVGMLYPGLHSVFGSLELTMCMPGKRPGLGFRVTVANARTRQVRIQVAGSGITGTVVAFARHEAVAQRGIKEVAAAIQPTEFTGSTALITGGSRGLGALTARIIAAGGGRVIATYLSGYDDAERLALEINAFVGREVCSTLQYDAMQPVAGQLDATGSRITHFYHFATTRIYRQKPALFDTDLFAEFTRVYLAAFHDLCTTLQPRTSHRLVGFFPSSVFVSVGRPRDMAEYAMAKAAGEVLCDEISRTEGFPLALFRRLPRMLTDQTATLAKVATEDALQIMLPVVREVQGTVADWPDLAEP